MRLAFTLIIFFLSNAFAENILYSKDKDPNFNPVQFYINGAFDVTQNPHYFNQKSFFKKHENLYHRIKSPHDTIKREGGYNKFFRDEFTSSRIFPNIGLHMIGSGYDLRMLQEYFVENEFSHNSSTLMAITLTYFVHFGNEALETTSNRINGMDHIADLFFFDVIAIPLFINDSSAKFIVNELGMSHWHFIPTYIPESEDFSNAGLNYVFRPTIFKNSIADPFFFMGMQSLAGATIHLNGGHDLSVGAGINFTDPLERKGSLVYGLFHEIEEKLSASLLLNGSENFRGRLNIYPKLLNFNGNAIGLFAGHNKKSETTIGLHAVLPIGLGLIF